MNANQKLSSVPSDLPDPPYQTDTKANGWRFEIDFERVKRSDTWLLAKPEQRPWLLMVWVLAFDQVPSGSLPNSHRLLGAMLGMDEAWVTANAQILLRGFKLHSDGRLYHEVVVSRMKSLIKYRENERIRKAEYRKKTSMSHGTDMGLPRESGGVPIQEQEQEQEQERKKKYRRFAPPSISEIAEYCLERRNGIDPEGFRDYYEARGWKLKGGQTMKSWQAAIRTWERNNGGGKTDSKTYSGMTMI